MSTHAKIYDFVFEHCCSYQPIGAWAEVSQDADCRIVPEGSSALLSDLLEHFSEGDLTASGVVEALADGVVLTPPLASGARPIFALRESPASSPIDLLTADGLISKRGLPAIAVLQDHRTQQLIDQNNRLFVVSSVEDMFVLRYLGFPSTIASGISQLNLAQYRLLKAAFRDSFPSVLDDLAMTERPAQTSNTESGTQSNDARASGTAESGQPQSVADLADSQMSADPCDLLEGATGLMAGRPDPLNEPTCQQELDRRTANTCEEVDGSVSADNSSVPSSERSSRNSGSDRIAAAAGSELAEGAGDPDDVQNGSPGARSAAHEECDAECGVNSSGTNIDSTEDTKVNHDNADLGARRMDESRDRNDQRAEQMPVPDAADLLQGDESGSPELVFVNWSPASVCLDIPDEIAAATSRLMEFVTHFDLGLTDVGVWRPHPEELSHIQFYLNVGGLTEAAKAIRESSEQSLFGLSSTSFVANRETAESHSYGQMVTEIEKLVRHGGTGRSQHAFDEAIARFEATIDRDLVSPILELAMASNDPMERSLINVAATVSRRLHRQAPFVDTRTRLRSKSGMRSSGNPGAVDWKEHQKDAAQLLAIYKEIKK